VSNLFWLKVGLATMSGVLFIVTLIWRDWIELLFHVKSGGLSQIPKLLTLFGSSLTTASVVYVTEGGKRGHFVLCQHPFR
jgi:hypothetical protein